MSEKSGITRRQALGGLGLMGAGALLSSCFPGGAIAQTPNVDVDVLNFALNLEYLEAEFYLAAVGRTPTYGTGAGMAASGGAAVTGGTTVNWNNDLGGALSPAFRQAVQAYATEIAIDEENHVKFLRSALGAAAVARPAIDIGPAFAAAANAALGTTLSPAFNPYDNALYFLHGAFIFEDVGVTAYKGAA
ncbi:MAG TPA: ferritin-like domain-containing protein, partial [Deinococcales bacterium]|nr:ferritin-like domain-containing protein [Deinococcales bacterium]